jgi:hypothetical protein
MFRIRLKDALPKYYYYKLGSIYDPNDPNFRNNYDARDKIFWTFVDRVKTNRDT